MNEVLVRIIADCAAFFELSNDSRVDPDAAVQQLEQMVSMFRKLSPAQRAEVVQHINVYAMQEERERGRGRYWQFLKDLPDALGYKMILKPD